MAALLEPEVAGWAQGDRLRVHHDVIDAIAARFKDQVRHPRRSDVAGEAPGGDQSLPRGQENPFQWADQRRRRSDRSHALQPHVHLRAGLGAQDHDPGDRPRQPTRPGRAAHGVGADARGLDRRFPHPHAGPQGRPTSNRWSRRYESHQAPKSSEMSSNCVERAPDSLVQRCRVDQPAHRSFPRSAGAYHEPASVRAGFELIAVRPNAFRIGRVAKTGAPTTSTAAWVDIRKLMALAGADDLKQRWRKNETVVTGYANRANVRAVGVEVRIEPAKRLGRFSPVHDKHVFPLFLQLDEAGKTCVFGPCAKGDGAMKLYR